MHKQVFISILAAAILAIGVGSAAAKPKGGAHGVNGAPPHASAAGMESRSTVASRQGANKRGFCPPGQAKKPGRGSAFNC